MPFHDNRLAHPFIIVDSFLSCAFVKNKTFFEVFQTSHFGGAALTHAGNRDMQLSVFVLIGVLLRAKCYKALVICVMFIHAEIVTIAGRIIRICAMPL